MCNLPKKIQSTDSFELRLIGIRISFLPLYSSERAKFIAAGWAHQTDASRFNVSLSTFCMFSDPVYWRIKSSIRRQPESRDQFVQLDRKIPKTLIFNLQYLENAVRVLESSEE